MSLQRAAGDAAGLKCHLCFSDALYNMHVRNSMVLIAVRGWSETQSQTWEYAEDALTTGVGSHKDISLVHAIKSNRVWMREGELLPGNPPKTLVGNRLGFEILWKCRLTPFLPFLGPFPYYYCEFTSYKKHKLKNFETICIDSHGSTQRTAALSFLPFWRIYAILLCFRVLKK
jgi:hypothetical protein